MGALKRLDERPDGVHGSLSLGRDPMASILLQHDCQTDQAREQGWP